MTLPDTLLLIALVVAALAAVLDLRTSHIPNWLTLGALAIGILGRAVLGYRAASSTGAGQAALYAVVGAVVCAALPYLVFRVAGVGGGDVKLLAALGALCGPVLGLEAQFYAFFVLSIFVAARLTYSGQLWKTVVAAFKATMRPFSPAARRAPLAPELMRTVCCAPAIFGGLLLAVLT